MSDVRIGILGTAAVASYAIIDPARSVAGIAIAAVGSRSEHRGSMFADEHGIERALSYDALIADPAVDAVYVALPNHLHTKWSLRALAAGKAVLCEKPLACNAAEARACSMAASAYPHPFVEAFHWRYHPIATRLRQIVADKEVGVVEEIDVVFRYPKANLQQNDFRLDFGRGGGVLMDAGCYAINLLRLVWGEPRTVLSADVKLISPQVDVAAEFELSFHQGLARVSVGNDRDDGEFDIRCVMRGRDGAVTIRNPFLPSLGAYMSFDHLGRCWTESVDATPSYNFQAAQFAAVVRGEAPILTSVEDAVSNQAVVDHVYERAGLDLRRSAALVA